MFGKSRLSEPDSSEQMYKNQTVNLDGFEFVKCTFENEERFSLGGAAHEPSRVGTQTGGRAGERKTDWTKPLPPPPRLWVLNGADPFAGEPSGHSGRRFGANGCPSQALVRPG
jgi:hypothetical protein